MAIVRATGRASRLRGGGDESPEMISADESDEEEECSNSSTSDEESDPSDADSGMGSDEFDLSELGEASTEFCQVGNQSFSVPLELYDLADLTSVLSLETWNECLTEEERFGLTEFLPDMDHETLSRTLAELFGGKSFHFGSPVHCLFEQLKGGELDPRVVLYRRGLSFFQKREHYCLLRKYHNSMVGGLIKIRDAWQNCPAYGIEERLRLLNIMKSQRSLSYERNGDVGPETDLENSDEGVLGKRFKMDRRDFDLMRVGKDNVKAIMKVTPPNVYARKETTAVMGKYAPSGMHGFEKKVKALKGWSQMRGGDTEDEEDDDDYPFEEQQQAVDARFSLLRPGKKRLPAKQNIRGMECGLGDADPKSRVGLMQYKGKGRTVGQSVTVASYNPHSLETMSNAKYPSKNWMYPVKHPVQRQLQNGKVGEMPYHIGKMQEEAISLSQQVKDEDRNVKSKKWKSEDQYQSGKNRTALDSTVGPYNISPAHFGNSYGKTSQASKGKTVYNGRIGMGCQYDTMFSQSEETESDSSEKFEEDGESPFVKEFEYPKAVYDPKKSGKLANVERKLSLSSQPMEAESYSSRGKHKNRTAEPDYTEDIILVKKTRVPYPSGKFQQALPKPCTTVKKRKIAAATAVEFDPSSDPHYLSDHGGSTFDENRGYLDRSSQYLDGQMQANASGNKYPIPDTLATEIEHYGRLTTPFSGCNSVPKKRKGNAIVMTQDEAEECIQQTDGTNFTKKKGKKKAEAETVRSVVTPDMMLPEKETADVEPEPKPQKKAFPPIMPSKHTGFSFSVIHLLSAIRKAMITPHMEDIANIGNHLDKSHPKLEPTIEENKEPQVGSCADLSNSHENNMGLDAPVSAVQSNLPSLTVQEIVNRVRTNPGDPFILETQEPLQDLVRGVLKIFSSRTAPLGAKGWKALVAYEKSNKSWSWVGPVVFSSSDNDIVEEETSPEAWGLPHKTLVKLVDSFANWLKSGQETLKQIGSLPPPPAAMLLQLDEKERFRELRAQKSLNTISPSSEEVREYFRKEELLRYSIPDRAFSYTAVDGKKSIVAPLRRGGGKPTSKARDHFMLKPDRPPHVTILCLVRDAAARLPSSIGTRADVCTLIRDSQYIVEDVSDEKVNQVVSGALDRLHYERDPCVQFDGDRKLWVYLHRDREEEDFEDDGTSSTKKWKRPRKDSADQPETAVNDAGLSATGDSAGAGSGGYEPNPELNADTATFETGTENIPLNNDFTPTMDHIQSYIDPPSIGGVQGSAMSWEPLGLNPLCENKMLCQENSTNEDFDDEAFSRERRVGFLSASIL